MVGADLRAARYKQSKRTARPEVGPYRHANQMRSISLDCGLAPPFSVAFHTQSKNFEDPSLKKPLT